MDFGGDAAIAPGDEGLAIGAEMHGGGGPAAGRAGAEIPERRLAIGIFLESGRTGVGGGGEHDGAARIGDVGGRSGTRSLVVSLNVPPGQSADVGGVVAIATGAVLET